MKIYLLPLFKPSCTIFSQNQIWRNIFISRSLKYYVSCQIKKLLPSIDNPEIPLHTKFYWYLLICRDSCRIEKLLPFYWSVTLKILISMPKLGWMSDVKNKFPSHCRMLSRQLSNRRMTVTLLIRQILSKLDPKKKFLSPRCIIMILTNFMTFVRIKNYCYFIHLR